jgi:anti-anti-sigma factor
MVIGIIINISKRIKKSGGQVFILKPSEVVEKLLHDVGLLSYFNIVHSEEELLNTLESNE